MINVLTGAKGKSSLKTCPKAWWIYSSHFFNPPPSPYDTEGNQKKSKPVILALFSTCFYPERHQIKIPCLWVPQLWSWITSGNRGILFWMNTETKVFRGPYKGMDLRAVMSASKLSSPAQSQNKHLLGWPKKELIHSPHPSSRTRSIFKEESLVELNKMFSRVGHFALWSPYPSFFQFTFPLCAKPLKRLSASIPLKGK